MPSSKRPRSGSLAAQSNTLLSRSISACDSGRRNARPPKSRMNESAQASAPSSPGSQSGSSASMSRTARAPTASATFMYCSISRSLLVRAAAWLLNPATSSSGGSTSAGLLVSLSRSRTVRLYSNRVRRRIGVSTTQRLFATPSLMARSPLLPIAPLQAVRNVAAISRQYLIPWGSNQKAPSARAFQSTP